MNNEVELEVRPRPLSTGLWTLFSWLRRDDRSDSSESLSSAGSDRTVASFAFLAPAKYQPTTTPLVLPPPGPPTDSYKRRVLDRNLRRQYDRDITLHRKYGLFKSSENTCGYDAFSLPPARRIAGETVSRWDRERRATSECFQRRLAHVPGKRRAPLPPIPTAPPTSLTRRNTRKRRAPLPPVKSTEKNAENNNSDNINNVESNENFTIQMNQEKQKLGNNDVSMGCKSEKYSKKERSNKDTKTKSEKSFLKQIFDGKKRNSGIDISSVKLLPSISELDKQAAEIIKTCKLNTIEENNNDKNIISTKTEKLSAEQSENWICVTCLRKFNSSVINCLYCLSKSKTILTHPHNNDISSPNKAADSYTQTERKSPQSLISNKNAVEEKQKLKEMLKEMKDSLPKRTKHGLNIQNNLNNVAVSSLEPVNSYSSETPTLRVGSTIENDNITSASATKPLTSNISKSLLPEIIPVTRSQIPVTMQPTSLAVLSPVLNKSNNDVGKKVNIINRPNVKPTKDIQQIKEKSVTHVAISEQYKDKKDLHTPLKISSLLNPVYVPKNFNSNKPQGSEASLTELKPEKQNILVEKNCKTKNTAIISDNLTKPTPEKVVSGPSTSQIIKMPVKVDKVETKLKIEIQKSPAVSSVMLPRDPLSVATNKTIQLETKVNDNSKASTATTSSPSTKVPNEIKGTSDQHSRRRDLIHQLEQSIAKGDERAAAEAAAKLAQLRLSCSVLSFSSQILSPPSTSKATIGIETDKNIPTKNYESNISKPQSTGLGVSKENSAQKVVSNIDKIKSYITPTHAPKPNSASQKDQTTLKQEIIADANKDQEDTHYEMITIAVLVEDREATRGPVHLLIRRQALMKDLRREAEASLGVATNLQRWIVGRVLCVDDNTPVSSLSGPNFNAPFYLCVVESDTKTDLTSQAKIGEKLKNDSQSVAGNVYTELVELEQQALVPNAEKFECNVCMEEYLPGRGAVLRECVHIFCKDCLSDVVRHCEEPDIPCPAMGCRGMLQEREIRALVTPQDYERWLARGLAAAESGTRNAFHCRTRDCKGWALCEPGVQRFPCPVCKHINCVPCQAIHDGETCEQHRAKLVKAAAAGKSANTSSNDDGTRTLLNSLIAKGEALECPECSAIITKKWGCDWVKCSACKTEICWVTRGRRWGPGGKGDTSGGCRCGVDGKRCHPSCGYCH